ncbi:MAG: hypothetical protein P8L22_01530 [Acidimicrobiales bacterium]|nr:hypothetical protein [Acidimicrobiales bacterium]
MPTIRKLSQHLFLGFILISFISCSAETQNEITTQDPLPLEEVQEASDETSDEVQEASDETSDGEHRTERQQPNVQTEREWFAGVYLPRHCPEAANKDEFVIPTKDEILECKSDNYLEVRMHAELVRSEYSSEDLYGVQQYLRIFQMMEHNPTTGQFGLWGQWIGDDRARPHGPFNSIEGGLFIHDKMGRSKFPKYMASAATHLYNPLSDTGGGWGFFEARIDCSLLGRVTLSNTLIVPPNLISFDEDQKTFDNEGGIYLGTSWVGLPIFGGAERIDEQPWSLDSGKITWTFLLDAANFSGPAIAYVPEHWSRRVDRWNSLEFLDDLYEWDQSLTANSLIGFVEGTVSQEELYEVIGNEPWFLAQPDDPGWDENPYWVKAEQTLGYSPASPYLPTGNEMPPIPVFSQTDDNGRIFIKIFPPLFPKEKEVEPFVLNVQTFDVDLYNNFVDIFIAGQDLSTYETSFADFGIPMQVERWGEEPWEEIKFSESNYEDEYVADFFIDSPLRPREISGEVNVYFEWDGAGEEERGWGQYYEIQGSTVVPVEEKDVPLELTELAYGTIPYTTSLAPHELAENGIKKEYIEDQSDNSYWSYTPDYSCYECPNGDVCDQEIHQTILDDGSIISYQWYRFRDQPLFHGLIQDYPETYTEEYLADLQQLIERMHKDWGSSQLFLERPTTVDELHLVEIDHGLLVEPPEGKEFGWVPIVIQVEQPDGIWQDRIDFRETPLGPVIR